jgi:hypothetical protein
VKKMPDKTDEKQGKFKKGKSGNPLGRPRGTRNKATALDKNWMRWNKPEGKPKN